MTAEQKLKLETAGMSLRSGKRAATIPGDWRLPLATVTLTLILALVLFSGTVASMVSIWSKSSSFGHGFLVAPISLYLAWTRRHELADLTPRPSSIGLLLVPICGVTWLLAEIASVAVVQQFAFVAMLQAILLATLGFGVAWRLALPLLFLFFAVPAGEALLPPLQDITARMIVWVLQLLQIPVFLDGYYLTTAGGKFHVAEACAGLRYLVSSAVIGTLFASMMFVSPWRRAAFILLSVAVPILANGIRATMIVLLAHYSDGEIATGVDHFIYGWVFLSFVTVILLLIGMWMRGSEKDRAPSATRPTRFARTAPSGGHVLIAGLVTVLAIVSAPAAKAWIERDSGARPEVRLVVPTPESGTMRPLHSVNDGWKPRIVGADAEAFRMFQVGRRGVALHVAFFARERRGAEAVSSMHSLEDGPWRRTHETQTTIEVEGTPLRVIQTRLSTGIRSLLVWQWYWVDGQLVGNPYVAKALQAKAALLDGDRSAALVTVAAEFDAIERPPIDRLQAFLRDFGPLTPALRNAMRPAP